MTIVVDAREDVLLIMINRPHVMNALDPETNTLLAEVIRGFEADVGLKVAVLSGAGEAAFCAGADLKRLIPQARQTALAGQHLEWNIGGLTAGTRHKPVIAAVNGHCLAGGLEMALACDIRIASPNATFGLAETKWGIIPGAGGTQRLPRAVPLGIAMEMILSGQPIDAAEALRVGLINRVVPSAELVPAALNLARTIASRGPLAVPAARRAILEGLSSGLDEGMKVEHDLFASLLRTSDAAEGPRAFSEKREPKFTGT